MLICPSCRAEQMKGSLFCSECGSDLQASVVPTLGLPNEKTQETSQPALAPLHAGIAATMSAPPAPRSRSAPGAISQQPPARRAVLNSEPMRHDFQIMILNTGRLVECPDKDNVIIGRSDKITGDSADIDLATDNALGLGVSRRHACINFRDGRPYLTDLGSLNRTWLNRQIMMRGQPYQLKDSDEIRLGNAILKVVFKL